ncbi:MAG TPA: M23 family metallopeptidase [Thermoleophilaceae bacterium]|nr:M23 family metallopeptidase [Thermoleophilaceae bacterium]
MRDIHLAAGRCVCVLVLCLGAFAPGAAAQTSRGGGGFFVSQPKVLKVSCVSDCATKKRARGGSSLMISGAGLASAAKLLFHGSYGKRDDVTTPVRPGSDTVLRARVPGAAVTGPVSVTTAQGATSPPSAPILILPPAPPAPNAVLSPVPGPADAGAPVIETGTSRTKAYVGARRAVTFSYRVSGAVPSALTVELVSGVDGSVIKSWAPVPPAAGEVESVSWNGRLGRAAATPGRYSFRLTAATPTGAVARSAQTGDLERDAFDLYDHVFPVRGKHDFGSSGAQFGAGRSGHSHQGHDVFASCGTRMVAARGGRVQFAQYHAAAGNYIVIDGDGSDVDYAYMHLAEPSPFRAGDRVFTGQRIGSVGDTGNAQGCHLHFELWGAPGWYDGGDPFDPLPALQAWDSWS